MPSLDICQWSSCAALLAAFCFVNIGCSESDSYHHASGAYRSEDARSNDSEKPSTGRDLAAELTKPGSWSEPTKSSEPVAPAGWETFTDKGGLVLQHPTGWKAAAAGDDGRIEVTGAGSQRVVMLPVFVDAGRVDADRAAQIAQSLANRIAPDAIWKAPQVVGSQAVRLQADDGRKVTMAGLKWSPTAKGNAGYFFLVSASSADFKQATPTFAKILASLKLADRKDAAGTAEVARATEPEYVRWQDPQERAFTVEVPKGWQIRGGLTRMAAVDVRVAAEMISPDGQIRIYSGDAQIPNFTIPTEMLSFAGFREGTWYRPGYDVALMVQRYVPAPAFAQQYAATKVAVGATDVHFDKVRDQSAALNLSGGNPQFSGVQTAAHAGDVLFTCTKNGQPQAGYVFAATQLTGMPGTEGGLWSVTANFGYLAPADRAGEAEAILRHVLSSYRVDPTWSANQQRLTGTVSSIVADTNDYVSKVIRDTYDNRQHSQDTISRRRENAILDLEDVVDPTSGKHYKVQSGSNYYWIDGHDIITGANTFENPAWGFEELIRIP